MSRLRESGRTRRGSNPILAAYVETLNCVGALVSAMANLTLSVPDALYEEMKRHPEIRWSEVARQALARKLEDLGRLDALLAKSTLRERDVREARGEGIWTEDRELATVEGVRTCRTADLVRPKP